MNYYLNLLISLKGHFWLIRDLLAIHPKYWFYSLFAHRQNQLFFPYINFQLIEISKYLFYHLASNKNMPATFHQSNISGFYDQAS